MRYGWPALFRLLKRTLLPGRASHAPLTLKRFLLICRLAPLLLLLSIVHRLGLLLDEVLFPGYRRVRIAEPVFIVGIPRSGTTFLHRVLSRDTGNFTSTKLWELIFAPSIVQRKVWTFIATVDRVLGGRGRRIIEARERRVVHDIRAMHRLSLFEPEEDEYFLMYVFASLFLMFPFPFPEELWHLVRFDVDTPPADRRGIMTYYRQCVQRHLYVHGPQKRFLSKNPAFSSKVDAINAHFPDAKVVCTARRPFEAIPSFISFMSIPWDGFQNDSQGHLFRDRLLEIAGCWYRHPVQRLAHWPEDRHAFLLYDDVTARPRETVIGLYERFGLALSPAFDEALRAEQVEAQAYKSHHVYRLEDYDLTAAEVFEAFGDVFERFGFSPDRPDAAGARGDAS